MRVGIDLSLTSTGLCVLNDDGSIDKLVRVTPLNRGMERVRLIVSELLRYLPHQHHIEALNIEGYSFGSRGRALFDIAECGGIVRWELMNVGYEYNDIPPSSLKKWATGKGNADKGLMLATAIRKFGYEGSSHDEADALLLAHYTA